MSLAEFFATTLEYSNPYDEILKLFVFWQPGNSTWKKFIKRTLKLYSKNLLVRKLHNIIIPF